MHTKLYIYYLLCILYNIYNVKYIINCIYIYDILHY